MAVCDGVVWCGSVRRLVARAVRGERIEAGNERRTLPLDVGYAHLDESRKKEKEGEETTSVPVSRLSVVAAVCYLDEMGAQHTRLLLGAPGDLGGAASATTTTTCSGTGAGTAAALAGHYGGGEGRVEQGRTGGGTLAPRTAHGWRLLEDGGRGATARRSVRRGLFDNLLGSLFARLYVSNIWIYIHGRETNKDI